MSLSYVFKSLSFSYLHRHRRDHVLSLSSLIIIKTVMVLVVSIITAISNYSINDENNNENSKKNRNDNKTKIPRGNATIITTNVSPHFFLLGVFFIRIPRSICLVMERSFFALISRPATHVVTPVRTSMCLRQKVLLVIKVMTFLLQNI